MIWACSQQILENWDIAEKHFKCLFHCRHFLLWVCDDLSVISANFRKLRFAEKHLEHPFSLLALFIIGVWWFHLVLSKFQKTEILLRSISNTRFHYKHFLLWVCDDLNLFSANFRKLRFCWEAFWHLFSLQTLLIISLFCSVMFWACSQQILENWDFTEKCFEHSFSLQTLFIMGLWWFELVLSKFQKTEKRFEHFFSLQTLLIISLFWFELVLSKF